MAPMDLPFSISLASLPEQSNSLVSFGKRKERKMRRTKTENISHKRELEGAMEDTKVLPTNAGLQNVITDISM